MPSARHDAEVLAAHSLGVERRDLWRHDDAGPRASRRTSTGGPPGSRCSTSPALAYFRHLELAVGPGVFVPRPETEVVVDAVLDGADRRRRGRRVVVDLGTGSGAIALAVATEVPGSEVHAVEADPAAHAWALRNCAGSPVDLRLGDMADAFPELDGTVDVVVSNPPYIPVGAVIRDPEVAAHDPALALWSGDDGLDAMRVVERVAARLLRPGGAGRGRARRPAGRLGAGGVRRHRTLGATSRTTATSPAATATSPPSARWRSLRTDAPA